MLGGVHGALQPRLGPMPSRSTTSAGTVYQHARVASARSGRSRSHTSITRLVEICLRWYAITWLRTSTLPRCTTAPPSARVALVGDDRDLGLGARLGVLVVVVGREHGNVVAEVESLHAVLLALVEVDRARVRDAEDARLVDGADRALGLDVDELVLDRRPAAQPDAGRGRAFTRPVHVPAAWRELIGLHELAHGIVETLAEPAAVVGRERQLVGRARDLRGGARTGSAGSRPRVRARVT